MYQIIINPETGRKVSIYGKIGQNVLQKYVSLMNGGATSWELKDISESMDGKKARAKAKKRNSTLSNYLTKNEGESCTNSFMALKKCGKGLECVTSGTSTGKCVVTAAAAAAAAEEAAAAIARECTAFNLTDEDLSTSTTWGDWIEQYDEGYGDDDPKIMESILKDHGDNCRFLMALIKKTGNSAILNYLNERHHLRTNFYLTLETIVYDPNSYFTPFLPVWETSRDTIIMPIGTKVNREFPGHGAYLGEVESYNKPFYTVKYPDDAPIASEKFRQKQASLDMELNNRGDKDGVKKLKAIARNKDQTKRMKLYSEFVTKVTSPFIEPVMNVFRIENKAWHKAAETIKKLLDTEIDELSPDGQLILNIYKGTPNNNKGSKLDNVKILGNLASQ